MGLLSLVCCVLAVSGALAQSLPGGWSETSPVDQRTLQIVFSVCCNINIWRLKKNQIKINSIRIKKDVHL